MRTRHGEISRERKRKQEEDNKLSSKQIVYTKTSARLTLFGREKKESTSRKE
jgi:hypothetical protein